MPRAKGMFELGMLGAPVEGFWGATGSLGNLARAASISSLLIIAFVAALTCLGAIRIVYLHTQSLSLLFQIGKSCSLLQLASVEAAVGVLQVFYKLGKCARVRGGESEEGSHRFATPTFPPPFFTRGLPGAARPKGLGVALKSRPKTLEGVKGLVTWPGLLIYETAAAASSKGQP